MMTSAQLLPEIAGGVLIGLSVGLLFVFNGRIAGVSGFFGDALANPKMPETAARVLFLVGLVAGYLLVRHFVAGTGGLRLQVGWGGMVLAGLLVGYGTRLGCGCTSGHGICGIARVSPRSLAATAMFMTAGVVTVFLLRLAGWR
jgi:uncharacterized membrane protein YedE/YeeE